MNFVEHEFYSKGSIALVNEKDIKLLKTMYESVSREWAKKKITKTFVLELIKYATLKGFDDLQLAINSENLSNNLKYLLNIPVSKEEIDQFYRTNSDDVKGVVSYYKKQLEKDVQSSK
ncbi:hypothetical protein ACA758_04735 [Mycoplasmopsis agassizii]|uniref:Uncharacterized protein n=1 Tax=Mycoplasmopsis agassizii TaxID=33922 RepID=A0A1W1WZ57_9BACT|nr:hypothetical protein [Mycoplasmopsis agassizii]PAF54956.1 hypothetical protein CJF60_04445 [Mycoplasmopsis agassizii]PAK21728.1 hypothetical protein CJJ23_00070 [Mycoplasmopsis agassizii]SMC16999.1 hypothetical protein SAMN02745179_00363 [Mycoplasmopsis agassizii]